MVSRAAARFGLVCLLLVACRSAPARFFVLTAEAEQVPVVEGALPLELALAPVRLPALLDRPQLVTVVEGQERRLTETARWIESLDENVTRVLAENLSRLLGTEQVVRLPTGRRGETYDYTLHVEVLRFDVTPGEQALLEVRWDWEQAGVEGVVPQRERVVVPLTGLSDSDAVAAMSACLAELAERLAAELG